MWFKGFLYQAASWKTARRVVAKVEFHAGELFPRVGFIVTNLEMPSRAVVRFYNKRGTAEQLIKEGKQAVKMTVAPGRRASESAAIRGDAGPDRTPTSADGIRGLGGRSPSEVGPRRGWTRGSATDGFRWEPDRWGYADEKSFHNVANKQARRTMVPFSRSKRKFRAKGALACAYHQFR
jgi:hypothetical protein